MNAHSSARHVLKLSRRRKTVTSVVYAEPMSVPPVSDELPDVAIAEDLVASAVGSRPTGIRRFTTGSHHYVFEALFENRPPVVIRIAAEHGRSAMAGASRLSHRLRPLGVPLPKIIAEGLTGKFAYLVLERLRGRDLRDVVDQLSVAQLEAIAKKVVDAQNIVGKTGSQRRYGYSINPADAPYDNWHQVLDQSICRSKARIESVGLFPMNVVDRVADLVAAARDELSALRATPFLPDTTTKNVIVAEDGTFSGIVDVDELCFGDPRCVAALTLAALTTFGGPTKYVDMWMKLANFQDDRIFRLYVATFVLDFMSERGQSFNDNPLPSLPDGDRNHLMTVFNDSLLRICPAQC
jgi:aminoglycoside phosphotransferase